MTMVVNKWYFPIFVIGSMTLFYLNDNTSITPTGAILGMVLAFIGLGITERLDKLINQNNIIVKNTEELEENTRALGMQGK